MGNVSLVEPRFHWSLQVDILADIPRKVILGEPHASDFHRAKRRELTAQTLAFVSIGLVASFNKHGGSRLQVIQSVYC